MVWYGKCLPSHLSRTPRAGRNGGHSASPLEGREEAGLELALWVERRERVRPWFAGSEALLLL